MRHTLVPPPSPHHSAKSTESLCSIVSRAWCLRDLLAMPPPPRPPLPVSGSSPDHGGSGGGSGDPGVLSAAPGASTSQPEELSAQRGHGVTEVTKVGVLSAARRLLPQPVLRASAPDACCPNVDFTPRTRPAPNYPTMEVQRGDVGCKAYRARLVQGVLSTSCARRTEHVLCTAYRARLVHGVPSTSCARRTEHVLCSLRSARVAEGSTSARRGLCRLFHDNQERLESVSTYLT